ncbi:MAG: tRNA lysidine(34) synthetase TilS [Planctomycetota bacterium]|jgi:tRNA(Ile)-lysidine synthase
MPSPAGSGTAPSLPVAARRHPLVTEMARRLRTHCRVPPGATVLIALSGGADSSALLVAAATLRQRGGENEPVLAPVAAHVHHHLRDGADADASWVEAMCARLGITLHVEHVYPQAEPGNLAAAARRLRYDALADVARRAGATHVAVAHHAEDQLETILIALGRGTGLDGLAGMPWTRPLGDGVQLVRPLLGARRGDCEDLCRAAGLDWRIDPSNLDPASARARLRQDVLPVLDALWPDAARRVTATADLVEAARQVLEDRLQQAFGDAARRQWDRAALARLPASIVAAGLRRAAVEGRGVEADRLGQAQLLTAAEAIRDDERRPREFRWPDGVTLRVTLRSVEM